MATVVAAGGLLAAACGDTAPVNRSNTDYDASFVRDGGIVEPPEAGGLDAGVPPTGPSCESYCDLVMATCTDDNVQYASHAECLAVCSLLPLGKGGGKDESTVGCRELYAGGPAKTDSVTYCSAAGPFGGNLCGDRCGIL